MHQHLQDEVKKLRANPQVEPQVYHKIWHWVTTAPYILKAEGTPHHLCAMFAPLDRKAKQVFLVHHRKANLWMIPGGHVEPSETAVECVIREYAEELGKSILPEQVKLFNLALTPIENPRQSCKTHYDLWYIIDTSVQDYIIEAGVFYEWGWYGFAEALMKVTHPDFNDLISKLSKLNS